MAVSALHWISILKASDHVVWPDRQIQRKFEKHASDFGIGGNYTPQNAEQFKQVLRDFLDQADILKIQGTDRGQAVTLYTDPGYGTVVLVSPRGELSSGWK